MLIIGQWKTKKMCLKFSQFQHEWMNLNLIGYQLLENIVEDSISTLLVWYFMTCFASFAVYLNQVRYNLQGKCSI